MYIKTMKKGNIRLKPKVVPRFFECQKNRITTHGPKTSSRFLQKKEQQSLINNLLLPETSEISIENKDVEQKNGMEIEPKCKDMGVQVLFKAKVRSKGVQCTSEDLPLSKMGKKRKCPSRKRVPKEMWLEGNSTDSVSSGGSTSTFILSELSLSDSDSGNRKHINITEEIQKRTFFLIEKNPKLYLGLPSHSLFIVNMLAQKCKLDRLDIFLTLKKIKLNLSYRILADDFSVKVAKVCNIIQKTIPLLAGYLYPFVQFKTLSEVQEKLPIPFRHRYKNVQCIIDCFEISIQKPSDPILQSLSWSQYKGCNTMKYLIACTPNGFISYISSGFGGRSTDKMIVEESTFLNKLDPGAHVMADRGFKHLEDQLAANNNQLVRPPSVLSGQKNSKQEVKESKRIASLRIHVERVISRIREFAILQPHATIHLSLVKYLDLIVQIVCGVINLQDYLVK